MKEALLNMLRCPVCGDRFRAEPFTVDGQDICEGLLTSSCGAAYPIVGGIPRILPDALTQFDDFVSTYRARISTIASALDANEFRRTHKRVADAFTFEWLSFDVLDPAEDLATFTAKTAFNMEELSGKRVLDAGCGGGRYARLAAEAGAEVVAIDLSRSVEKAKEVTKGCGTIHLLQANLMNPPLGPELFDCAYSIGVLDHTPDTRQAFEAVAPLVRPGGSFSVWVYAKESALVETTNRFWRGITTRLPKRAVMAFSYATLPYGWLLCKMNNPKWGLIGKLVWQVNKLVPGVSAHPDPRKRVCDTFDWFAPPYQWHHTDAEVEGWFKEAGFGSIVNLSTSHTFYHRGQGQGVSFTGVRDGGQ